MVELLAVIAIMGVLLIIAIPAYQRHKMQGFSSAVNLDVSNASMYIAQNQDTLKGYESYNQNDNTPIEQGIPGFKSSSGVILTTYGSDVIGRETACIQGYHANDNSVDKSKTSWHINIDERKMTKGLCRWNSQ